MSNLGWRMSRFVALMSRSCVASPVSEVVSGATFNVLDFPRSIMYCRSCGLVQHLFTVSDNSSAASGRPTIYFPSIFIVKVSPIFSEGATHNFGLHPLGCFAKFFVSLSVLVPFL